MTRQRRRYAMRVAAIYDIHGNLPALEAVLDVVLAEEVDEIVVGGDVVPGPMPGACLAALQDVPLPVRYIHGNGERDVLAVDRGEMPSRVPPQFLDVMRWVADQLQPGQLETLAGWPAGVQLDMAGLGLVDFCHATPRDENEIFTRVTPEKQLRALFEECGAAVVICGHTHMQFDRNVGSVRVVNAGSVGMPFGCPGAYWAVVGPDGVRLRHTSYDLEDAAARIHASGYPSEFDILDPPRASEMLELFEAAALGGG